MSPGAERSAGKFRILGVTICLLLIIATGATYARVFHFGFIGFDDYYYVPLNPLLKDAFTPGGLWRAFISYYPDNWFPITTLSLALDYLIFGLQASWYHVVNVGIHALACVMLYVFLMRATRQRWPSAFVAAVFALHPAHVESVAWIAERKDVLCAFFWFATLWCWVRYTERPSWMRYLAALGLFSAGLMSKPMIVTLPLLLPILDIWPLRRRITGKSLVSHLPFWALSALTCLLTILAQRAAGAIRPLDRFPLFLRVENALTAVLFYLSKTFWPTGLSIVYGWPKPEDWGPPLGAALAIAAISALFFKMRSARPWLLAGWLWFLVTLIPVIGLVQVGLQARADRYMYVPMVGVLIVVAWGAGELLSAVRRPMLQSPLVTPIVAALAVSVCCCLAVLSWQEEQYWKSAQTLFEHAVAEDDQNYLAWEYRAASTDWTTELRERIECYRAAVRLRPDLPEIHGSLGRAYLKADWLPKAIEQFNESLRIAPNDARVLCDLGAALLRQNRVAEAISDFEAAVRAQPGSAVALNDLAVGLSHQPGSSGDAEKQLQRAIALRPDDALTQSNLGLILLREPDGADRAVPHFLQALAVDPKDVAAHLGLAKALSMPPFSDERAAAQHLNTARQLAPNPDDLRRFESLRIDYGEDRSGATPPTSFQD